MAELWVTTREYREPCNCRDWRGPQQQEHVASCPSMRPGEQVITLGLKMADNDRLWQLWRS